MHTDFKKKNVSFHSWFLSFELKSSCWTKEFQAVRESSLLLLPSPRLCAGPMR